MVKKLLAVFFLFLFAMQFTLAQDTEIKIKSPEFTEIHLTVLDPDADYSAYAIYKKTSDAYGDATFIYSGDELIFDLMVVLKKSDKTISSEKYRNNYIAGESVYLEIIPSGYELKATPIISGTGAVVSDINITNFTEESNITVPILNNQTNESAENNGTTFLSLLGSFLKFEKSEEVKQDKGKSSFKSLYYPLGVVLILAIAFFTFRLLQTKRNPNIKVRKLSEINSSYENSSGKDSGNFSHLIKEAEEKIKQAQDEIGGLKKKQQIKDLREKMIKEKEELRRLSR